MKKHTWFLNKLPFVSKLNLIFDVAAAPIIKQRPNPGDDQNFEIGAL